MGALLAVAVLFVPFTLLEFVQPGEPVYALLSLIIAACGVISVRAAGLSWHEMRVRFAPLSLVGGALLAAATLLMLPILASSSAAMPQRQVLSLLVHNVLFVAWHVRTFTLLPSPPVALVVATVLFLAGTAWAL